MLAAIKNVQVVVHLTLLTVVVPANAQIFYGAIAEMVAFDPVEMDVLLGLGTRPEDDYEFEEADEDIEDQNGQVSARTV